MQAVRIYREPWAVDARLKEIFDVRRSDFFAIIREVVGARADAVENDPINTPGQFMYIHGTRNTRALFRAKGWLLERKNNVELVRHPDRFLMVGYQTVDLAAVDHHDPQAISGKGSGSRRVVDEAQLSLFSLLQIDRFERSRAPIKTGLWYLCISVNEDDVRAEISLARAIEDGNFKGFIERIFLLEEGGWEDLNKNTDDSDDAVEFEPVVRRK